jgi:pre-mRNA-splicing factor CDC5/CEF1
LITQLTEIYEQIEQTQIELKTFENLRDHELTAIPKRLEVKSKDIFFIYFDPEFG